MPATLNCWPAFPSTHFSACTDKVRFSDLDLAWPKLLIYLSVQHLVPGGFQQL